MNDASRGSEDDSSVQPVRPDAAGPPAAVRWAAAIAGLAGACALVAATLLPVLRIAVDGRVRDPLDRTGWDAHGPALLVVAALAVVLLGAALRGSAAAAVAVAACGLTAVGVAVLGDLPDVGDTGVTAALREGVVRAGPGAYAEILGGVLLLLAGGVLALARRTPD